MAGRDPVKKAKAERRKPRTDGDQIAVTTNPPPQTLGYICIPLSSTTDADGQRCALITAGVAEENIYCDSLASDSDPRTALTSCSQRLRQGDTVVLWTLAALDEAADKVNAVVQDLAYRGITIKVLRTPDSRSSQTRGQQRPTPETKRIPNLDGLRGFAAVAVVVFHAMFILNLPHVMQLLQMPLYEVSSSYDLLLKLILIVFNGEVAVILFFILSGAVLSRSLQSDDSFNFMTVRAFTINRVFRIYPMLVVAIVSLYVVANTFHTIDPVVFPVAYTPNSLLLNVLLIDPSLHGTSWTLQVEMIAIPVILILYPAWKLWGVTVLYIVALYASLATLVAVNYQTEILSLNSGLLRQCLLCFSLGMLVATEEIRRFVRKLPSWSILLMFVIMLFSRQVIPDFTTGILVTTYLAFIVLGWLYHHKSVNFLSRPISVWLGRISYSLYLLNVMVMIMFMQLLFWLDAPFVRSHYLEFGILLSIVTLAMTIPLASWTERWIERPFIKLGRQLIASGTGIPATARTVRPAGYPQMDAVPRGIRNSSCG
jgi:peptidoglycan/LPS O-acetylase OafA/YrhL